MASRLRDDDGGDDDEVQFLYEVAPTKSKRYVYRLQLTLDSELTSRSCRDPVICQICSRNLDQDTPDQRNRHYDFHFNDGKGVQPQLDMHTYEYHGRVADFAAVASSSSSGNSSNGGGFTLPKKRTVSKMKDAFRHTVLKEPKQEVFWHTSRETPPPSNYTPGACVLLSTCITKRWTHI